MTHPTPTPGARGFPPLPEMTCLGGDADFHDQVYGYTEADLRAFAEATVALRAQGGQAGESGEALAEIVLFGGDLKEVSWRKGRMPSVGTKLYGSPAAALRAQAAPTAAPALSTAATDVLAERQRQISAEGWTPEHDDHHGDGSMAMAAAAYAVHSTGHTEQSFFITSLWKWTGWGSSWFKPKGQRHDLVRSGALVLAEIERIDRAALQSVKPKAAQ